MACMKRNEKGVALVVALVMTLLVSIIGVTAIKMSEIGFISFGSEKKYLDRYENSIRGYSSEPA
jgi:hypothetical protein